MRKNIKLIIGFVLIIFIAIFYFNGRLRKETVISHLISLKKLGQYLPNIYRTQLLVRISLVPKIIPMGCILADLDAIEFSLKGVPERGMIATLERLDQIESKSQFFNIHPQDLIKKSINFKFSIPRANTLSLWGLFVCNDSVHEKFCRNKKTKIISKVIDDFYYLRNTGDGSKIEDSVFIFQLLMVIDGYVFYLKNPEKDLLFLKDVFARLGLDKIYLETLDTMDQINKDIFSNTFQLKNDKFLSLDVPGVNRKLCRHMFNN